MGQDRVARQGGTRREEGVTDPRVRRLRRRSTSPRASPALARHRHRTRPVAGRVAELGEQAVAARAGHRRRSRPPPDTTARWRPDRRRSGRSSRAAASSARSGRRRAGSRRRARRRPPRAGRGIPRGPGLRTPAHSGSSAGMAPAPVICGDDRRIEADRKPAQLAPRPGAVDAGAGHDHDPRAPPTGAVRRRRRRRIRHDRSRKLDAGDVALVRLRAAGRSGARRRPAAAARSSSSAAPRRPRPGWPRSSVACR